jgi:TolA-binding protein
LAKRRRRLTKKEIKEDEVAEFFIESVTFVKRHWKKIVGIALAVVIGSTIWLTARYERSKAEAEAQTWIWRAGMDMKSGNVGSAIQSYSSIIDRFRGTWGHSDASFFLASAQFSAARYDTALTLFESYLNLAKRRDEFTVSSKQGIAQCLEQLGRYEDAASNYRKVQREHPDSPLAPDALMGAARSYELAGDLRSAEQAYSELLELYPNASQAAMAKMRLLETQARL